MLGTYDQTRLQLAGSLAVGCKCPSDLHLSRLKLSTQVTYRCDIVTDWHLEGEEGLRVGGCSSRDVKGGPGEVSSRSSDMDLTKSTRPCTMGESASRPPASKQGSCTPACTMSSQVPLGVEVHCCGRSAQAHWGP